MPGGFEENGDINLNSFKMTCDGVPFEQFNSNVIKDTSSGQLERLYRETFENLNVLNQESYPRFLFKVIYFYLS